jgi:dTDP-4-amino-4,6-dideoxygalactose transaminase
MCSTTEFLYQGRRSLPSRGLATFCGFAVACGNGIEALQLALMAKSVGLGDAVMVPNATLTATTEAVHW